MWESHDRDEQNGHALEPETSKTTKLKLIIKKDPWVSFGIPYTQITNVNQLYWMFRTQWTYQNINQRCP